MQDEQTRPSGGDGVDGPVTAEEQIDEAGMESFPCSDPPAFNVFTVGPPRGMVKLPRDEVRESLLRRRRRMTRAGVASAGIVAIALLAWRWSARMR